MSSRDELLRGAMAHATVLASFNVEEFGTERIERLTAAEIAARVNELHAITQFSGAPLQCAAEPAGAVSACPGSYGLRAAGLYGPAPGIRSIGVTTWTFIWLMVLLKIPIVALFLLVRWAVRQTPETAPGAGRRHRPAPASAHPHHPRSRPPRPPRRGPHGDPAPASPPRVRAVASRRRLPQR